MANKLTIQLAHCRTHHPKQEMFMMRKMLYLHMQVINSHSMILWELLLINMVLNTLVDIVVAAKAIPQGLVLLLGTPLEMVQTKIIQGPHVKPQLTPLQTVSKFSSLCASAVFLRKSQLSRPANSHGSAVSVTMFCHFSRSHDKAIQPITLLILKSNNR